MMGIEGPSMDKEFQAHGDAHTLAEAKEIMADEKRLKVATEAAEKIAEELKKKSESMDLASKMYPKMPDTDKDGK